MSSTEEVRKLNEQINFALMQASVFSNDPARQNQERNKAKQLQAELAELQRTIVAIDDDSPDFADVHNGVVQIDD